MDVDSNRFFFSSNIISRWLLNIEMTPLLLFAPMSDVNIITSLNGKLLWVPDECYAVGLRLLVCVRVFKRRSYKRGRFSGEDPEMFSHPESRSKVLNSMTSESLYSPILTMNRGSHHTRVSGVYTTRLLDTDYLKMALQS